MALVPETLFNNRAKKFGSYVDERGSIQYIENHVASGVEDNFYDLGKIINIDVSDIDGTVIFHYDRATAKIIPLFTFDNGAQLCLSCYVTNLTSHDLTKQCLFIECVLKVGSTIYYPNGTNGGVHEFDYIRQVGAGGVSGGFFYRLDLCRTFGLKAFVITDYAYGQRNAILGQTKAVYLDVRLFVPYQSYLNQAGQQSFSHIFNTGLFFSSKPTGTPVDWVSNPQYIWFGYGADSSQSQGYLYGVPIIFHCDNLNSFITKLNNLAPFPDPNNPGVIEFGLPSDDPTQEEDPSGPGGGDGTPDPNSDPIPFPDLPTGGALSSGAIKAFRVTPQIMTAVFNKLWNSSLFDISTFQKLTNSPIDNIISLQCLPIAPTEGAVQDIKLGNFDTEQDAHIITQEYYTIDCGSLAVAKYWGSALDYQPYTRVQIFLPFIGIRDLDTDDVMGKTIHVKYNYSIFDGNLTAQIMCGQSVLYKFNGNVRETIPVTAQVSDALQRAFGGIASGVALGVAGGPAAAVAGVAISSAVNVAMAKTQVQRSGDLSGSTGLLDDFRPYFIIHRPIQSLAENYKTFKGYPSNITAVLSSLHGYTEVEYIHLTGIDGATDTELTEIENLLMNGVII